MKIGIRKQRLVFVSLMLALLASISLAGGSTLAVVDQEMLKNGNFEGGFSHVPGCGTVGQGWGCFTNGGSVTYGFYDDQWAPVVADGAHSQLIELNTMQFAASESDRFAGIYQTVHLVRGGTYQLRLSGLMREHNPDRAEDPYRYRVQWGYTTDGSTDWSAVTNWVELPWDKIDDRLSPTGMESYSTSFVAPSKTMTLFFRVWKKWGTTHKELDVNLDAISLFGPAKKPPVRPDGPPPVTPPAVVACVGPNQIRNGSFEDGFTGGVGNYWTAYNNGGAAAYGFYDEMWPRVISDGAHGQLIEINTWGFAAADPDRFAGIYQVVHRLKPGATYEFALSGLLREEAKHPGEDGFRYRVQWGYAIADADPSEADITNWVELPWDEIYLRTDPGPMLDYSVRFHPPAKNIIIGIRAWKKWGTTNRELDVNLDAIRLSGCPGGVHPPQWPPKPDPLPDPKPGVKPVTKPAVVVVENPAPAKPSPPGTPMCSAWHIVVKGDTMSKIAARYGSSVAAIAKANKVANPNVIYIGQKLCIAQ
jgi:hypothetical protein